MTGGVHSQPGRAATRPTQQVTIQLTSDAQRDFICATYLTGHRHYELLHSVSYNIANPCICFKMKINDGVHSENSVVWKTGT
jgi:hypothetical protein